MRLWHVLRKIENPRKRRRNDRKSNRHDELDILTKAKDLIEENGFVQGVFVNQDNNTGTLAKYCAIGDWICM